MVDATGAGLPSANVNIALSEQSGYQRPITVSTGSLFRRMATRPRR